MGRLALVALIAVAVLPRAAAAEDDIEMEPERPVKDPKVAKKWRQTGNALVLKGNAATRSKKTEDAKTAYENAITAYEKAIEAGDDVNVYFDLATAEEKAGKLDRAATHYRMITKAEGARPDIVKKATARFDDLTMEVGLVTIITKPEGATVSIAGAEVGKTPMPEPLVLMPGTYTFAVIADGHQPTEVAFLVEAGSESERTVELDPVKIVVAPREPVDEPDGDPIDTPTVSGRQAPSKLPLYIGAGAAGGFALIATITGISAVGKHTTFEDQNASPGERADAQDAGKTLALVTDLCLVGAIAAGGFTAYWYFAKYRPAQRKLASETSAKAAVVPWVKPDAGGLVLAGSF